MPVKPTKFVKSQESSLHLPKLPKLFGGDDITTARKDVMKKHGYNTEWDMFNAGGDMMRFPQEIRNPTLNPEQFFLPKYSVNDGSPNIELNVWFDHYYRFHPLVQNLINLHSTLPLSRFGLVGVSDPQILDFYEQTTEDIKLFENLLEILKIYYLIGEVPIYSWWSEDKGTFTDMTIVNSNDITVTGHYMLRSEKGDPTELYEWVPDEYLRSLLKVQDPNQRALLDNLHPEIKLAIENGQTVILDPFSATFLRRTVHPKDLRGTSILTSVLKYLLLEDKLREQQYAMAQSNINPYKIWSRGNDTFIADDEALNDLRNLIYAANYDNQFNVIGDHTVKLDIQGAAGKVANLQPEFEYINNQILTGLWANKSFTHGEGPTYANASVSMRVLMMRYLPIRSMLENFAYQKLFLPIALKQEFFKTTSKDMPNGKSAMIKRSAKDREPIIPLFDWRHKQSLIDDSSVRSMLQGLVTASKLPMKVLCDSLDLDYDYVKTWMENETGTIFDNDVVAAKKTLIASAAGQGLKDTGKNMVKRVADALMEFSAVFGKQKALKKEGEPKVDDTKGPEESKEVPIEEQKEQAAKLYTKDQLRNRDEIIRKYTDKVDQQIKNVPQMKAAMSTRDLVALALKDNYYPPEVVKDITDQLYDMKVMLAKEGQVYIIRKSAVNENELTTINKMLEGVFRFNEKEYEKRLYNTFKTAVRQALFEFNSSSLEPADIIIPDFKQFALTQDIPELEVLDKGVLSKYWETIYPKVEAQVLDNFVKLYKSATLSAYKKLGVKLVYLNDVSTEIDGIQVTGRLDEHIIPETDSKKNLKMGKFNAINLPIKFKYITADLVKKHKVEGFYDFKDVSKDDLEDTVLQFHCQAKYDSLDTYDEILDLFAKYYNEEHEDEEKWFIFCSKKYLKKEKQEFEIQEYMKKIYKI